MAIGFVLSCELGRSLFPKGIESLDMLNGDLS